MATQRLDFSGYFFGVEVDGHIIEYPNYDMAAEGFDFLTGQNKRVKLKMQARYTTPWMDAKKPDEDPTPQET